MFWSPHAHEYKATSGRESNIFPWFARMHGYFKFSTVGVPPVEILLAEDRLDRGCTFMVIRLTAGSFLVAKAFLYQSYSLITIWKYKKLLAIVNKNKKNKNNPYLARSTMTCSAG